MSYKMTTRGAPPAVTIRTYRCTDCEHTFDFRHDSRDEPAPDCPFCATATSKMPSSPHIANAALNKAVDMAWEMAQESGMTDMKSNVRPGDTVAMPPKPMQTAERESIQMEVAQLAGPEAAESLNPDLRVKIKDFWRGPAANVRDEVIGAGGARGQQEAAAQGVDALTVLDGAKKWGNLRHTVEGSAPLRPGG